MRHYNLKRYLIHLVIQDNFRVIANITGDYVVTQVHQDQGVMQELMVIQEQQEKLEHVDLQVIEGAGDHKDLWDQKGHKGKATTKFAQVQDSLV